MAKNEPELKTNCPRCGHMGKMEIDRDMKLASNVTVLECVNPELDEDGDRICEYRFAKDQSVKLSGSLVREAAHCMLVEGGYSSLGEFVRECIRERVGEVARENNAMAFGNFLTLLAEKPEVWEKLLEDENDEQ